ncbi:MAG: ribosome maturation factor [Bacteroidetes bacterium]|nr:ribosome maturation factor [Bacteroidota bacterium]MBS1756232.1 ribosome maturation factor [Bacteroidota bacterium]
MSTDTQIETIKQLLQPLLYDDIFLVEIKVKPVNNIKIFLDADSGLPIEKCIKINRGLYKIIEETGQYPDGNFSLEVSSPGIGEPLKLHRQFVKNIGRELLVEINNNPEATDVANKEGIKITGILTAVNDDNIEIEYTQGKGKKAIQQKEIIAFAAIKKATVQIKF